ncbi:TPX2, C-terminal [Dillenia turbinata]|uniref:TPX2, C-terminal n=1 Tax=Dillenia turbinata TaxID=194707 RepID=A0AAN8YW97_9MAGN
MGREFTDNYMERKPNGVSRVISPGNGTRIEKESVEEDYEVKECTAEKSVDNKDGKQDVLGVKSMNFETDLPEGENGKSESQKSSTPTKAGLKSPTDGKANCTVPQPFALATEKRASCVTRHPGTETASSGGNSEQSPNNMLSPNSKSPKKSQPNSPPLSRKPVQHDHKKFVDDDDAWSVASSTAASVRTNRSRTTVASTPIFRCDERLEKRKEYYTKLEEKHQALEAEKSQFEARQKEEQEADIKQLRKTMVFKANPIPSFYSEGPPPKVELKKLPVTRPVSPKLNKGRRKSCGDAVNPPKEEKISPRGIRHSIGTYREDGAKNKIPSSARSGSGSGKAKPVKASTKTASEQKPGQTATDDVTVQS